VRPWRCISTAITFDAADPQALAGFWADVSSYQAATVNEFVAILSIGQHEPPKH
jgi:hypothetical protein